MASVNRPKWTLKERIAWVRRRTPFEICPLDFGIYRWPWNVARDWFWVTFVFPWAVRRCKRVGHKWTRGGASFNGDYTEHWAECGRCGYQVSD